MDPTDPAFGSPAILSVIRQERPIYERFYGSLDPQRAPHVLISTMHEALGLAKPDAVIQMFAYKSVPILRQTLQLILHAFSFDKILVSHDFPVESFLFPTEPEIIEVDKSMPNSVQNAQRKARWIDLKSRCHSHTIDLRTTKIEGVRLGGGTVLDGYQKQKLGLRNSHVEVTGQTLFVVTDEEIEEGLMSRAMDFTHTNRVQFATPDLYDGCLCAFSKLNGEDFGFGTIEHIDFATLRARVLCTTIPPVPVPLLRIGSLRVDHLSNEHGELKPWTI
jgi:hypothetical protein